MKKLYLLFATLLFSAFAQTKEVIKSGATKALGVMALGYVTLQTTAQAALDTAEVDAAFDAGVTDIKSLAIVIIAFLAGVYVVKVLIRFIK